jgi:DNA-binding response OmpR family regulator
MAPDIGYSVRGRLEAAGFLIRKSYAPGYECDVTEGLEAAFALVDAQRPQLCLLAPMPPGAILGR